MNDGACSILEVLVFQECVIEVYFHMTIVQAGGVYVCALHTSALESKYYNHKVS